VKARLELGDVFVIPLDADRAGIGQVVATYGQGAFYYAIFDLLVHPDAAEASIDQAVASDVLFLAPSLDSRLPVPYLTVIGTRPVRPGLPLPAHREVDAENMVQVVDYSGRRRRRATDAEARRLQTRRFVAPLRLARALRATAGMEPWKDSYAELVPDPDLTSDKMFGAEPGPATWPAMTPPRTGSVPTTRHAGLGQRFPVAPTTGALRVVGPPARSARHKVASPPGTPVPGTAPRHRAPTSVAPDAPCEPTPATGVLAAQASTVQVDVTTPVTGVVTVVRSALDT